MLRGLSSHLLFFLNCNLQFTLTLCFFAVFTKCIVKKCISMTRIVQLISRYAVYFSLDYYLFYLSPSFTLHLATHQTGFTELKVVVSFYSGNTKKVVAQNYFLEPPCKICSKKISHYIYQCHECKDAMLVHFLS